RSPRRTRSLGVTVANAPRRRPCPWGCGLSSAHRLLHEGGDLLLVGGGQLRQRERGRPHGAVVEVRRVLEAERRVPLAVLRRAVEEADDLALLGVRGHPVPALRPQGRRTGRDDLLEGPGQGPIRSPLLRDLREHVAFPGRPVPVCTRFGLQLSDALLHRGLFFGREPLVLLAGYGGALGGPPRALGGSLALSHYETPPSDGSALLLDPWSWSSAPRGRLLSSSRSSFVLGCLRPLASAAVTSARLGPLV